MDESFDEMIPAFSCAEAEAVDDVDENTPRPVKGETKARKNSEVPALTEDITKTSMWISVDSANLSPSQKVILGNLEVLAAQISKLESIFEHMNITIDRMKNQLRRSSMSSVTTARAQDLDDEDEDPTEIQDQLQVQQDIQGDIYCDLITKLYIAFVNHENKTMHMTRNSLCKNDAREFQAHLLEILPLDEDEGGLGNDHPFTALVEKASPKTFLDIYVQLGKANRTNTPKPNKGGGKKNTGKGKEVQIQQDSHGTVEVFSHSDEVQEQEWDDEDSVQEEGSPLAQTSARGAEKKRKRASP